MKQVNRVQLSFFSILKIFAICGVGVALATLLLWVVTYVIDSTALSASITELLVFLVLSPFTFILFAVLGYPFFNIFNKYRGGLELTVVKRATQKNN